MPAVLSLGIPTAAQQNNYAVRARMDSTAILQLYEFGLVASLVGGRHHREA